MDDWDQRCINDWLAKGMLDKNFILKRVSQMAKEYRSYDEEGEGALERVFRSISSTDGLLTEETFISFLQKKSTLPCSPGGIQAGKMIYNMLVYLADIPFARSPGRVSTLSGLSLAQLDRSLVWLLPDNTRAIMIESNDSRMRTKADHRRLILQSLASTSHAIPYNHDAADELANHEAFDGIEDLFFEMCAINRDGDGDEIYHDLLHALYSTQEERAPWRALVKMDSFRPLAKQMTQENDMPKLYLIGIPVAQFAHLVKFLLAFQFSYEEEVDLDQFDTAAMAVCSAFCGGKEASIITWPAFNHGLKSIAPYLFDPLYDMLYDAFLDKKDSFHVMTGYEPSIVLGGILTIPLASQLSTFLAGCSYFGDLVRYGHYISPNFPAPSEIIETIETVPSEAYMLVSGETKSGERCIFGVFSREPKLDGIRVQTNIVENYVGLEPCSIFQLYPVQDLFRGIPGKPGWKFDNEMLAFGQDCGVVMTFTDGLHNVEVRHHVPGEHDNEGVYRPNLSRGSWTVDLEVSEIEIWSELRGHYDDSKS